MDELQEMRKDLKALRDGVVKLSLMYTRLPQSLAEIDYEELLNEIRHLCGYIDRMIDFKNPLVV